MKLNELIRQLKKINYRLGNVDCVSPSGENFTPVEYYEMKDSKVPLPNNMKIVFGPIGTKANMSKKIALSKVIQDIQEAQSNE